MLLACNSAMTNLHEPTPVLYNMYGLVLAEIEGYSIVY